jgi:HTH-type transcriptional regulator/antitoxin HigA
MTTVLANPAEMIARGAPHVIHNDAELEIYTDALFQLTALKNPSSAEVEAIELLTLLVERYEQQQHSIPVADPASIVRFLMEQQNLTQRELIPQFGSESAVSMFLSGQRNLTIEQVRKLSARFKLPADVFIPRMNPHAHPSNRRRAAPAAKRRKNAAHRASRG